MHLFLKLIPESTAASVSILYINGSKENLLPLSIGFLTVVLSAGSGRSRRRLMYWGYSKIFGGFRHLLQFVLNGFDLQVDTEEKDTIRNIFRRIFILIQPAECNNYFYMYKLKNTWRRLAAGHRPSTVVVTILSESSELGLQLCTVCYNTHRKA